MNPLVALIVLWIAAAIAASVVHHKLRGVPVDTARQSGTPQTITLIRRPYDQDHTS